VGSIPASGTIEDSFPFFFSRCVRNGTNSIAPGSSWAYISVKGILKPIGPFTLLLSYRSSRTCPAFSCEEGEDESDEAVSCFGSGQFAGCVCGCANLRAVG
jgi:hypothetical protein